MKRTALIHAGLLALLSLLAACSTPMNPAPIIERNNGAPVPQQQAQAPAPASALPPGGHSGSEHGYYQVKKGDTLTHIALDNGQSPRDIAAWNNLSNPNDIKVDQVLRVLPPEDAGGSQAIPVPSLARTPVAPAAAPGAMPASGPTGLNKVGPRGEKKPYTDAAFADMQKPEAAPAPVAVAAVPAAPVAAPTAADKAAEVGPDEAVTWGWPADGKVGPYDEAKKGIDIAGKSGQQVMAAANGKVLYAGTMRGYGNLVIVKHNASLLSAYAHNKTILVKEGQSVSKGQPIAEMGDTDADGVKLHFEVRQQGKPVDPTRFLPPR